MTIVTRTTKTTTNKPKEPAKKRGRPTTKSKSSQQADGEALPEAAAIESTLTASAASSERRSTSTRSHGRAQLQPMLSDPERPLRAQSSQYTQPETTKRQRSINTNSTQPRTRPPPIPEDREPILPPLPPIGMAIDGPDIVLHSEASFRETNLVTQSDELDSLMNRFTQGSYRRQPANTSPEIDPEDRSYVPTTRASTSELIETSDDDLIFTNE
jgi:hypothetical protein